MEDLTGFNYLATKANVMKIVKEYRRSKRALASFSYGLKSPVMSDMPKGTAFGNSSEDMLTKQLHSQQVVNQFEGAVNALFDTMLIDCMDAFFTAEHALSIEEFAYKFHVSQKSVNRIKKRTLARFCETYVYSDLLVLDDEYESVS
ncbi:hypothetical protein EQG49_02390 [Periweissella cryptocerci]|uniref:Uncharacterized protein n=1 Tax=Periweissella cryptocerci TaxID=2506420 RepID=A0A4P6YS15_9LACO|nr:hypothetical protein [Periweissella cryptocerci]QBO35393.1 hypothetical protein EQG49_02390 [Periweissella cryptocerci]